MSVSVDRQVRQVLKQGIVEPAIGELDERGLEGQTAVPIDARLVHGDGIEAEGKRRECVEDANAAILPDPAGFHLSRAEELMLDCRDRGRQFRERRFVNHDGQNNEVSGSAVLFGRQIVVSGFVNVGCITVHRFS